VFLEVNSFFDKEGGQGQLLIFKSLNAKFKSSEKKWGWK